MKYKDYPKHDLRRCFTVLLAVERLGERATAHYLSLELECTRAEVLRALDVAREQLRVQLVKIGSSYRIDNWGVLDRHAVLAALAPTPLPAREAESAQLGSLVAAIETKRAPLSHGEADLFRFAAQLLKTRYPEPALILGDAACSYFAAHKIRPRPFPQVVADGMVVDIPRFRHAIENRLAGIATW